MITQEYRPKTFKEVAGQKTIVDTLKCIAKNPENAPRTIILQGAFGTGKTTSVRILARALNCPNVVNGEPCGNCNVCNSDLNTSPFYVEYDSAVIGNVDTIRELRETFYYNSDKGYRVIVLDEAHLISKVAQAALLKVFEETKGRIFFVLCTTDAQMLLPTIRSRSLELTFNTIPDVYLKENLKSIAEKEHMNIDDDTLNLIVNRSGGHARNAHMLLDRYELLGDVFKESVKSSKDDFIELLLCGVQKSDLMKLIQSGQVTQEVANNYKTTIKQKVTDLIYKLQCNSLMSLKTDYEDMVLEVLKCSAGVKQCDTKELQLVAKYIGESTEKFMRIYRLLTSDSIMNSFKSDKMFQAAMWVLYINL